ncbi:Fatty acid hydroxylase superfamily protein [Luteitalea pratensis]|uniref:Fatty acid hydroxylase superfamily protein n=1 Tax=Luteitalea pratensis TaxID=1855912 RepID=A0A143PUD9_LUTPR|nr:sterol desaturase family protein [Luteitalea pratensis]AMY12275.1 Fatty acid hydroxylase superfamily protein [Luteitalea pratensis]
MDDGLLHLIGAALQSLSGAVVILIPPTVFFVLLALFLKGREALPVFERAFEDVRLNLSLHFLDTLLVAPIVAVLAQGIQNGIEAHSLAILAPARWHALPAVVTLVGVVFVGDLISWARHRIEHTRLLWPTHAIHHSDAHMTWMTIMRFHPLNRVTTLIVDLGVLAVCGFPEWALIANFVVRHYYGEFIHADLPWMYGPLRYVFVSPVMHRWHHARDVVGAGSNFATVFAFLDYAFGTYHVPGLCTVPLGVTDQMGKGTLGQMLYPFKAWGERLRETNGGRGEASRHTTAP